MKKVIKFFSFLLIAGFSIQGLEAQNAEQLLQNMDKLIAAPKDKQADVQMIITNRKDKEKVREARLMQKGMDKKLYRYTQPEEKAGIATLSLPNGIMWLYMPSFNNPIKISLLSKSSAFNGTDFSFEDMSGIAYGERYTPKLVDSDVENLYLLELTPKIKKLDYSKIMVYLNKTYNYPVKMMYYNKSGKYDKVATYKYAKKDGYWYAQEVLMTDLGKDHSTEIILTNVKFDQGLTDDDFLVENLKQ